MTRWQQYCESLRSAPDNNMDEGSRFQPRTGSKKEPTFSKDEVEKAIRSRKNDKTAGPDRIPNELLKLGGDSVTKTLHRIITTVWNTGKWPKDWTQSIFIPLHKKGVPTVK